MLHRALFAICLVLVTVTPLASPPLALLLGAVFGLSVTHPFPEKSRKLARILLQLSVIGLGFAMDLGQVLRAGASGFVYTVAGIVITLTLGMALARLLRVPARPAYLISIGTAICGGSAIAAVGSVTQATDEEMSVSLGTVFLLNAVGLLLFPPLGIALGLTESQFGLWAALAIHDTSSVVGAGARYGALALAIATTVKLARALWIVPLTLATAVWLRRRGATAKANVEWPWFIVFFLLAAVVNTYAPAGQPAYDVLVHAARVGLTVTLFLIGTGITRASLKRLGVRPLALGVVLWVAVASLTLAAIRAGWIVI